MTAKNPTESSRIRAAVSLACRSEGVVLYPGCGGSNYTAKDEMGASAVEAELVLHTTLSYIDDARGDKISSSPSCLLRADVAYRNSQYNGSADEWLDYSLSRQTQLGTTVEKTQHSLSRRNDVSPVWFL
jgi:hypothetical protein